VFDAMQHRHFKLKMCVFVSVLCLVSVSESVLHRFNDLECDYENDGKKNCMLDV
jgi:hypothetical protein